MTLVKDDKSSKSSKKTIKKSTLSKPKPVKTIIRKDVTESVETTNEVEMCSAEAEMVTDLEDKEEEVCVVLHRFHNWLYIALYNHGEGLY